MSKEKSLDCDRLIAVMSTRREQVEVWLWKCTICNPSSLVSRLIQAPLPGKRLINPGKVASGSNTANSVNRCRAANASFPLTLAEISPRQLLASS